MGFIAHTGIFHKKNESENEVIEHFDDDFRKIIDKVIFEKITIIHKTSKNVYIISYADSGPFQNNNYSDGLWLPVHIYKMKEWYSGGIKKDEYEVRSENNS